MLISHAQNFEDVILWRALKHIENGFYIDIGAQDPEIDSVSLLFYERGWRGVHVEPTAEYSEKLLVARPDEEVIQAAISSQAGPITFFEIDGTGLSTGDPLIAERHGAEGWSEVKTKVPTLRLGELLDRYGDRDIHWLKIDVEGMEQEVLESWSPSLSRPWIVVVESTRPTSEEPTHAAWQNDIESIGYRFAYFDGLNRFYISEQHTELFDVFGPGPNIFDDFALSGNGSAPFTVRLNAEINHLQEALTTSSADASRRDVEYKATLAEAETLRAEVDRLQEALTTSSADASRRDAEYKATLAEAETLRAEIDRLQEAMTIKSAEAARRDSEREAALAEAARREASIQKALKTASKRIAHQDLQLVRLQDASALQASSFSRASSAMERLAETLTAELAEKTRRLAEIESAVAERSKEQVGRSSRLSWFVQGSLAWLLLKPGSRPRRAVGHLARFGLVSVRKRPRLKRAVRRFTAAFPALQTRLFRFAAANPAQRRLDVLAERQWYLEPEPELQAKWMKLLANRPSTTASDR